MNMKTKPGMHSEMGKQPMYMNAMDYGTGYQMYDGAFSDHNQYMPMKPHPYQSSAPMINQATPYQYYQEGSQSWQQYPPQPHPPQYMNKFMGHPGGAPHPKYGKNREKYQFANKQTQVCLWLLLYQILESDKIDLQLVQLFTFPSLNQKDFMKRILFILLS